MTENIVRDYAETWKTTNALWRARTEPSSQRDKTQNESNRWNSAHEEIKPRLAKYETKFVGRFVAIRQLACQVNG